MLDPGRPEFNVGDLVWVTVAGLLVFKQPVRILSIHKHDDGSLWAFVEGAEAAVRVDSLTAAPTDAGAAQDVTARPGQANDEQQEQAYSPNAAAMRAHLEHVFGGYLDGYHDGLIELAWTDTRPGKDGRYPLRHARMFGTDEIEELIAKAVQLNAQPMCNVYVGAALRKPDTPRDKRARDEHVLALTAAYDDLDKPGAVAAARKKYAHVRPTLTVITGREPHERAQEWRRLTEPATDPAAWRALLEGMAHAMGGDTSVVNPSHVMRLAGSIAWPMKEGRKVEMTLIAPPEEGGQASYTFEHLSAVFPPVHGAGGSAATGDGVKRSKNAFGFDGRVEDGRERYMLKTICAVLIEIVGTTGAAPTAQELFDLAWPQYERCTDFSRAGRGRDEFAEKCAYTVSRFLAGKIRGCETIEKTAELYRQRQTSARRAGGAGQTRRSCRETQPTPWTSGASSIRRPCRAACCRR